MQLNGPWFAKEQSELTRKSSIPCDLVRVRSELRRRWSLVLWVSDGRVFRRWAWMWWVTWSKEEKRTVVVMEIFLGKKTPLFIFSFLFLFVRERGSMWVESVRERDHCECVRVGSWRVFLFSFFIILFWGERDWRKGSPVPLFFFSLMATRRESILLGIFFSFLFFFWYSMRCHHLF